MTKDPYRYFRVEARELLEGLTQGVLQIEQGSADQEQVASLLRLAHTLKGASRVVKQPAIAELAHSIESVLAPHRSGPSRVPKESVAELLRLADGIAATLATLDRPAEQDVAPAATVRPEAAFESVRVEVEEVNAVLEKIAETGARLTAVRQGAEGLERARRLARLALEDVNSGAAWREGASGRKLRGLVEELLAGLDRIERSFVDNMQQAERELAQARERSEHLLLLRADTIFPTIARSARDLAQVLGKRVEFHGAGGDIRLDSHILSVCRDALLHLVSNAVAHGIEAGEARVAAGKPATGRIELRFERRGGMVALTLRDDGAGIDVGAVRRAAVSRGIIAADGSESMGLDGAIKLILRGGVSTTGTVTQVSGRGVGLDIVRAAAERLKGEVSIESLPNRGTAIQVSVPVSLNLVPALIVESAALVASIPLESVRGTLMVSDQDIARSGGKESIDFEGRTVPFLRLSQAIGIQNASVRPDQRWSTVLVASGSALVAVGAERLHGLATVLVRMLPAVAAAASVVAGASLDAWGNPRPVLDPAGLVAAGNHSGMPARSAGEAARRPILVIDDSLTTRMLEQSILESAGHAVELATSAEEALEKAARGSYSLFLVDVEMPGMNGFEFVAKTRADPVLREVPAILVTSLDSMEDRQRGQQAGACAYIVKSEFDQGYLLQTIQQQMRQR